MRSIQQLQQKQPQVTNIREEWGVFLVSPKNPSAAVKTVKVDLKENYAKPTEDNLKKLGQPRPKVIYHSFTPSLANEYAGVYHGRYLL